MQEGHYETDSRTFTKRLRAIPLTVAGVTAEPNITVFRPPPGTRFICEGVITENTSVKGTVSDAPNILFDNGTDGQNIVAGNDLATTEGAVKVHTIAATKVLDHDHPLRLKLTDAADGATTFGLSVIVKLTRISG